MGELGSGPCRALETRVSGRSVIKTPSYSGTGQGASEDVTRWDHGSRRCEPLAAMREAGLG